MENIIIAVIIALVVFLLIREVVCWYFKLTALLHSLNRIEIQLKRLNNDKLTMEDVTALSANSRSAELKSSTTETSV